MKQAGRGKGVDVAPQSGPYLRRIGLMRGEMGQAFITTLWNVTRKCGLGPAVLALYPRSALVENGWFKSYRKAVPIDATGKPLPWLTYAATDFLSTRLNRDLSLFEYGCGFSTIWYCTRVKSVTSVEHDPQWAGRVEGMLPSNGRVLSCQDPEAYVRAISQVGKVDVIVVDGIARAACYQHAVESLTTHGVIVADDSARDDFKQSWPGLREQGFKEIVFTGLTPGHFVKSQTSILYRKDNCLGI
jgi:hypothetical protein